MYYICVCVFAFEFWHVAACISSLFLFSCKLIYLECRRHIIIIITITLLLTITYLRVALFLLLLLIFSIYHHYISLQ